tara:strand:+ start:76 stop:345 length:270 start_codon:yes stop_codon:yes gene_type:complete
MEHIYSIKYKNDVNKLICQYNNLRNEGFSCGVYGGVFDYYIADKLNIEYRTFKFHYITEKWTDFLWINDKNNILITLNKFINNNKKKSL